MYPKSYYDDKRYQQKPRDPLTLDIYPSMGKTQFELFEDDGITYKFKTDSLYNITLIECDPVSRPDAVVINISGQYEGWGYIGMPEKRNYYLTIHGNKPREVFIEEYGLTEMQEMVELNNAEDGWHFDPGKNVTRIKVKTKVAKASFSTTIFRGSS